MAKRRAAYSLVEVMGAFPYHGKARRASALLMDLQEGVLTALVKRPTFLPGGDFIEIASNAWTHVNLEEFAAQLGGSHVADFSLPTNVIVKAEKNLLEGAISAVSRQEDFDLLKGDWDIPSTLSFIRPSRNDSKGPSKFPEKYALYLEQDEVLSRALEERDWKSLGLECQALLKELKQFETRFPNLSPLVAAQEMDRYLSLVRGDDKPGRSKGGKVGAPKHSCWPDILKLLAKRENPIQGRNGPGTAARWVINQLQNIDKYKEADPIQVGTIAKELRRLRNLAPGKVLTPDYLRELLNHPSISSTPAKPSRRREA